MSRLKRKHDRGYLVLCLMIRFISWLLLGSAQVGIYTLDSGESSEGALDMIVDVMVEVILEKST